MKTLLNLIKILVCFLASCQGFKQNKQGTGVGILIDISDSLKINNSKLNVQAFNSEFNLKEEYTAPAFCYIATITNLRYTESSVHRIDGDRYFSSNIIERKSKILSFYKDIDSSLRKIRKQPIGSNGSFVCFAISKMLTEIAKCKTCNTKKVFVLSDLAENTEAFNAYQVSDMQQLSKNPKSIFKILDWEYPLPNLSGITIVFVHQPQTPQGDAQYHSLSQSFKKYYERKGAKVLIQTTIKD
jgi:hypothetical protein